MSTVLTINVQNQSPYQEQFFIFQQPAVYSGGPVTYSNSLYSRGLNGADSGDQLTFQTNTQYYAAVQRAYTATPQPGTASGYESVTQLIDLGASNNTPANNDCAQMTWDASSQTLGLCAPVNNPQVPAGAFRIVTAT